MAASYAVFLPFLVLIYISQNVRGGQLGQPPPGAKEVGAVYFASNGEGGNYIIANKINPDGTLTFAKSFGTFGRGLHVALQKSVDGLVICADNLFVVNVGSNSITMFEINPNSPTELKFIQTCYSYGDIPMSLLCNVQLQILCVLNAGRDNSVACFSITSTGLVFLPQTRKGLGLPLTNTLISPVAFGTPSDMEFTSDLKQLVIIVKGNSVPSPPIPGFVLSLPISKGTALGDMIKSEPVGIVPYSLTRVPNPKKDRRLHGFVFTDPGKETPAYGLGLFMLQRNGKVKKSSVVQVPIPQNLAACWSMFSPRTGNLFTVDVDGILSEFKIHNAAVLSSTLVKQYKLPFGTSQLAIADIPTGEFMYILNPEYTEASIREIHVLQIKGSGDAAQIQTFALPPRSILGNGVFLNSSIGLGFYLSVTQ